MKTRRRFIEQMSAGVTGGLVLRALPWMGAASGLLWSGRAQAATVLDPRDPIASGFSQDGTETCTPGDVLTLSDGNIGGIITLFATDSEAAPDNALDVVTTFHVTNTIPNNVDVGNHIVINDGLRRSAIARCIFKGDLRGMGLYSTGPVSDPGSYPLFVPVDWESAPATIRLRRYANGDAELLEVNGVAPANRALLAAENCPPPTRPGASVEFGAAGIEAQCTVQYSAFRSERVVPPTAGTLSFTRLRLADGAERLQFRADYSLGRGTDGIDPSTQPVTIRLSTPSGGQFYPVLPVNPLLGFSVQGSTPRRRWTLSDAERVRSGIDRLVFDEGINATGGVSLRDLRASIPGEDYSTVLVEILIGSGAAADLLTGIARLVEVPPASGRWRLESEP